MRIPAFSRYYKTIRRPSLEERERLAVAFNSWVLYFLLQKIHDEFVVKSQGFPDSLGVKWKALSDSRRIYKTLQRGEIHSKLRRRIREGRVTKKDALANRDALINIDTKRLINSLKPGSVIGGIYYTTNKDQVATVTASGISLKLLVPYADEVQEERPYFPVSFGPWLEEAIQQALPKLRIELAKNALI